MISVCLHVLVMARRQTIKPYQHPANHIYDIGQPITRSLKTSFMSSATTAGATSSVMSPALVQAGTVSASTHNIQSRIITGSLSCVQSCFGKHFKALPLTQMSIGMTPGREWCRCPSSRKIYICWWSHSSLSQSEWPWHPSLAMSRSIWRAITFPSVWTLATGGLADLVSVSFPPWTDFGTLHLLVFCPTPAFCLPLRGRSVITSRINKNFHFFFPPDLTLMYVQNRCLFVYFLLKTAYSRLLSPVMRINVPVTGARHYEESGQEILKNVYRRTSTNISHNWQGNRSAMRRVLSPPTSSFRLLSSGVYFWQRRTSSSWSLLLWCIQRPPQALILWGVHRPVLLKDGEFFLKVLCYGCIPR